jgi:hypothetical protein
VSSTDGSVRREAAALPPRQLSDAYAAAWAEWRADDWDVTVGAGLDDPATGWH